jgi:mRNA interferase RelE/StbE
VIRYRPEIPPDVDEVIRRLPPALKRSVRSAVRALASSPKAGEPLRDDLEDLLKFRVRRYRIVYRILEGARVIRILAVGERRTIYEKLAERRRAGHGEA